MNEEYNELNEQLKKYSGSAATEHNKSLKKIKQARAFLNGDEWALSERSLGSDEISLKLPKTITETVIGSVTENQIELSVEADAIPSFPQGHPFRQYLIDVAPELGLRGDDEAQIASDLLSHALGTYREVLKLDDKIPELLEYALTDGMCYFKDGVSEYDNDIITLKIVTADEIMKDESAKCWDDVQWVRHNIPVTKQELIRYFPDSADIINDDNRTASDDDYLKPDANTQNNDRMILEEWWCRDYTMQENEDGISEAVYPGYWKRVYRYKDEVMQVDANPFSHGRLPFHPLVGVTKPGSANGLSFVTDLLFDLCTGLNKATTAALMNMVLMANNKRLINPEAVINPGELDDNSISNIVLKEGYTFDQALREVRGAEISGAFQQVSAMLNGNLAEVSGTNGIPSPGAPANSGDIVQSGFRTGLLRRRMKDTLRSVAFNLIHNIVAFIDHDKAFKTMGGVGPSYINFNPHIFEEVIQNFNARFTIHAADESLLPPDPLVRSELTTKMAEAAGYLREITGLPLSRTLQMLPNMPNRNKISRAVLRGEIEKERADAEAKARGELSQEEMEIQSQSEKERRSAHFEVQKKIFQKLADQEPAFSLAIDSMGITESLFRLDEMDMQELHETIQRLEAILAVYDSQAGKLLHLSLKTKMDRVIAAQRDAIVQEQQRPAPQGPVVR